MYCKKAITRRALDYYRHTRSIRPRHDNYEFMQSLWKYSTKAWPQEAKYDCEPAKFEKKMKTVVSQLVNDCFDEYIIENPQMEKLNTLRIHPALADTTIAVPTSMDAELFAGIKKYKTFGENLDSWML